MINNINESTIRDVIKKALKLLYEKGPIDEKIMEELAFCKIYYPSFFNDYEQEILYAMGMFYKTTSPTTLFEQSINIFREEIKALYGHYYTPDQTIIRKNIEQTLFYSFSAPTSSGKSHVFRDIIKEAENDIVVIVPSRALISEYFITIIEMVSNEVLVLTFVDDINKLKTKRRIFILTPERAMELFKYKNNFKIDVFLFDEAQITEEKIRGLRFDALVRRTIREFPSAKKIFAHPFIVNPELHFEKHNVQVGSSSNCFLEKSVGQLFYYVDRGHTYLYSPHGNPLHIIPLRQDDEVAEKVLANNGTMLIYLSKAKIYDLRFLTEFSKYISLVSDINDQEALKLIEKLREYLGAGKTRRGKQSLLVNLMKKGIVLHHGSIPLKGRLIIEEYIKKGYARICFATSTLLRGINMPFDVVYIDNFTNLTALDFKNLIGRAGRTNEDAVLNVGCVICDKKHATKITSRMSEACTLVNTQNLDAPIDNFDEDDKDIVEAIQNDEFIDELNIPKNQYDRLYTNPQTIDAVRELIELLIPEGYPISGEAYANLPNPDRKKIKEKFAMLYISSLRNPNLTKAELSVISTSLQILLWRVQGKSFKETVQLRYNFITKRKEQLNLLKQVRENEITQKQYEMSLEALTVSYTQGAFSIPNKTRRPFRLFPEKTPIRECDYDRLVYDTYDYLDKVISLSIVDPICAALEVYYQNTKDLRAKALQNYMKFGTNSPFEILLLRYGFDSEDHEWLLPCITSISEEGIDFNDSIKSLNEEQYYQIARYI